VISDPKALKLIVAVFAYTVTTSVAAKVIPIVSATESFPDIPVLYAI
jgi:hypothetical protein